MSESKCGQEMDITSKIAKIMNLPSITINIQGGVTGRGITATKDRVAFHV